jgi:long-chain acyl-CoA synthetase
MLIQEFLERSTERLPGKTALVAGAERYTYRDIDSTANKVARGLKEAGVACGDRVVVYLDNSAQTAISIFGVLKADAVLVIVNPTTKKDKLAYILNNCRATAFITHQNKWQIAGAAAADAPSLKSSVVITEGIGDFERVQFEVVRWDEVLSGFPETRPPRKSIDIDLAALIYTSGTTGNPKGVMLTHQNMVAASTSITTYLENTEDDIIIDVLPLSFDYGLYQVIMAAQFGGTVILERTFLYPYAVINLIKKEKVTGFPLVPTIAAILIQLKDLEKERFDHLRYITNTAAALPESHIRGLQRIFPGTRIYSMYGLTECKRVSYLPPEELERRPNSIGKGMPNEQVYLVDEDGNRITEPNTVGELVVRGANVMKGYWELLDETNEMLREGPFPWEKVLYTGDLFRMDEEGYLYFVSRKDDIIKSRGEKVSPKEIENILYELPDVLEAAVVGTPDDILGEAIKAFIVLKKGSTISEREIMAHCSRHLEDFMIPKFIEMRESLPKTSSGKITKKGL